MPARRPAREGTVIVEALPDDERLLDKLRQLDGQAPLLLVCDVEDEAAVRSLLAPARAHLPLCVLPGLAPTHFTRRVLPRVRTPRVAYLPAEAEPGLPPWGRVGEDGLLTWVSDEPYPEDLFRTHDTFARGWIASSELLRRPAGRGLDFSWDPLGIAAANRRLGRETTWHAWQPGRAFQAAPPATGPPPLRRTSRVLALTAHYRCEAWLPQALASLRAQSRRPDGVAVIDDGSPHPPVELVAEFPEVTLLRAEHNSGPFRLFEQVIRNTDFDAYLFQDADDWSCSTRLALLLAEAERTGGELVGCQELRAFEPEMLEPRQRPFAPEGAVLPVTYPLDASAALARNPHHVLLLGTALLARSLWQRLGGFATGLRYGGDAEFIMRASLVARLVNSPAFAYYRRHRAASLTSHPETGQSSEARIRLIGAIKSRGLANLEAHRRGETPELEPCASAPPLKLAHLAGPRLW